MIVRPRLNWWQLLFVIRGSVLPKIAPQLLIATAFAVMVTVLHGKLFLWKVPLTFVPFSLMGLTLAIFLGFRNSTSYARYWEARTLWGTLLSASRTLARGSLTLVDNDSSHPPHPPHPPHAQVLFFRLIAYVHAVRHQLRQTAPGPDFERLLSTDDCNRLAVAQSKPAILLLLIGEWLRDRRRDGSLQPVLAPTLEEPLSRLTDAFGGCERIAGTPIPFTYSVIIHRAIYLYCMLLPFGLVDAIGVMTPVIVAFIASTFLALESLGAELEDPFGLSPNDLALDAMSWKIEATLREMLGVDGLPPPPGIVDFVQT